MDLAPMRVLDREHVLERAFSDVPANLRLRFHEAAISGVGRRSSRERRTALLAATRPPISGEKFGAVLDRTVARRSISA
jgi:hypothetical protein